MRKLFVIGVILILCGLFQSHGEVVIARVATESTTLGNLSDRFHNDAVFSCSHPSKLICRRTSSTNTSPDNSGADSRLKSAVIIESKEICEHWCKVASMPYTCASGSKVGIYYFLKNIRI